MKPTSKWFIALATAVTIIGPLMPKTVNLNVSFPTSSEKHYKKECRLFYKTLNGNGLVCGYRCEDNKTAKTLNKNYNSSGDCNEWITIE